MFASGQKHPKLLFFARSFCRPIRIHSPELVCSGRDIITLTLSACALRQRQARHSIAKVLGSFLCSRCFAGMLPGSNSDAAQQAEPMRVSKRSQRASNVLWFLVHGTF